MSDATLFCPQCERKLRLPAELLGQPVQCPLCGQFFTAPTPSGTPIRDVLPVRPLPTAGRASVVVAPGIALLIAAGLGLLIHLAGLAGVLIDPDAARNQAQQVRERMDALGFRGGVDFDPVPVQVAVSSVGIALCLLNLMGGIAMVTRRSYAAAWLGALPMLINCHTACCLSFPIGVWAVIALATPAGRAAFQAAASSSEPGWAAS